MQSVAPLVCRCEQSFVANFADLFAGHTFHFVYVLLLHYLRTSLFTYLLICLLIYLLTYVRIYSLTYILTYSLTYSLAYMLACLLTCLLTHSLTHSLTPWSTVRLEKLTGSQLVKKFTTFCGTQRFITAFTTARHLSLSWHAYCYCHVNFWRWRLTCHFIHFVYFSPYCVLTCNTPRFGGRIDPRLPGLLFPKTNVTKLIEHGLESD